MGNQLTGIAPSQIFPVEYYLADLQDFSYDQNLGSTRFFKVARAKHKEGLTVVKVFAIRDPSLPLKAHRDRLDEIKNLLKNVPNTVPFQKSILTDKAGILVRQYVKDNLYDRISTRPFLNSIEKRWIVFQLLQCLNRCHKLGVYHGDIKLENIMITSWNWVLLTDFASFKPTNLAEDNPADFSYFFDTSRRRTCYIAPERFIKTMSSSTTYPTAISTTSSSGSSIAPASPSLIIHADEIKTGDLTAAMDIFSLGCALTELFTEGSSPFDFSQLLQYRSNEYDPEKVLEKIEDSNIKKLVQSMMQKDPAARLNASEYLELQRDRAFPEYFYVFLSDYMNKFASNPKSTDEKIYRLKKDINKIIEVITAYEKQTSVNGSSNNKENVVSEGLVLIVPLLTSSLRALKHCSAKLNALEVLRTMANYLSPEIILDRLLPYLVFLAKDKYAKVRVAVVQTLTECLSLIKSIPRSDSNIFPEYILPNLAHIAHDEAVIVRMAYAENIASLAETALKFLEMTQSDMEPDPDSTFLNDDERTHHNKVSYDHELQALQELVQQSVTTLLSDPANAVKQTLLERGIRRLCVFFGRQKGNDVLLSHMITYLNDKEDRHLRGSFFDSIVGVAAYVGWQCCPILKPLLQQGLADSEEFVISKALCALSELTKLGLVQKQMLYDLVNEAIPLLIHPNLWIKQAAIGFICVVAKSLNLADVQCKLVPLLQPFLKHQVIQVDQELVLLNAVQDPLPRCLLDYLIKLPTLRNFLESLYQRKISRSVTRPGYQAPYREVDPHLTTIYNRMQSDGMTEFVEDQILAMKDHLFKVHVKKASISDGHSSLSEKDPGEIDLALLPDPPQTYSLSLARKKTSKKKSNVESPTVNMNEEWQHMFGTSDLRSPPSPKFQFQHQDSDSSLGSFPKTSSSGKLVEEGSEFVVPSDGKDSPVHLGGLEERLKPNHCAPCQEELFALIHKKQEEWISDDIIRKASELDLREEKPTVNKKNAKTPSGYLIAHLHEHRKAVNKLQIIPNTPLFASCSNDGTVKIWDCEKMEGKNVANRSKLTYNRLDGPVSCMTMCQNMQSVAAASENGNIHVFRYENTKSTLLYTRSLDPIEEGCAVDIDYFDTGSQSVLAYATVTGSIVGWDLRSPGTAWKLENSPCQGLVTSFCTDPHHCWLVVGTASGNMVCWDLRFQLPITTVTHPAGACIRNLLVHPRKKSAIFASVQGNNEVSLWDLESQGRLLTLWTINNAPPLSQTEASDDSVYSMCWSQMEHSSALLTAGSDRRIRHWDLRNPSNSHIVVNAANDPLPPNSNISYTCRLIDGTEVICENLLRFKDEKSSSTEDQPKRYPEMPPVGHHDIISSISTMQTSQPLILSASKDGVIKVWK
ncbi:phosphoinositide 3-kinase regulatory subunit 4-like [Uloborus diversus]|uniref:phosphoinositide 3-kinase regulatory subunit 4-like n=1 Tax=Uloborus diversus TaxID=327109 RepID=UPI00240A0EA5|nr:phosphoinositide 3-kinase regulatory subunit 4-like [Uloborus diversus]XP_054707487.1 phosphoinositide 3-kinase regulatory subunit 4-like [Uloborus diversus]